MNKCMFIVAIILVVIIIYTTLFELSFSFPIPISLSLSTPFISNVLTNLTETSGVLSKISTSSFHSLRIKTDIKRPVSIQAERSDLRLIYVLMTYDSFSARAAIPLIQATDNENVFYVIHHDIADQEGSNILFEFTRGRSNIKFFQEHVHLHWYIVLIKQRIIEVAFQTFGKDWDFLVFLRTSCFPLKSHDQLKLLLGPLKGRNIMEIYNFSESNSARKPDFEIRSGSALMLIEPKFASWVIDERNNLGYAIRHHLFDSHSASGYLQTMFWNSPFKSTWYPWPMDIPDSNGLPAIGLSESPNLEQLTTSKALFVLNLTSSSLQQQISNYLNAQTLPRVKNRKANPQDLVIVYGLMSHSTTAAKDAFAFIGATNGPNVYYVIHDTDLKNGPVWEEYIKDKPNMRFAQRMPACWGCWELVLIQLKLVEMANEFLDSWDFMIYTSGDTYPLRSNAELRRALLPLQGKNILESDGRWTSRIPDNYNPETSLPLSFRKGGQWMILSQGFASFLVNYQDSWLANVRKLFVKAIIPDESFIHTALWNSEWNKTWTAWPVYGLEEHPNGPNWQSPFLLKWPISGWAHPAHLVFDQREWIWNSNALFARKIDDEKLKEWLDEKRRDENVATLRHLVGPDTIVPPLTEFSEMAQAEWVVPPKKQTQA